MAKVKTIRIVDSKSRQWSARSTRSTEYINFAAGLAYDGRVSQDQNREVTSPALTKTQAQRRKRLAFRYTRPRYCRFSTLKRRNQTRRPSLKKPEKKALNVRGSSQSTNHSYQRSTETEATAAALARQYVHPPNTTETETTAAALARQYVHPTSTRQVIGSFGPQKQCGTEWDEQNGQLRSATSNASGAYQTRDGHALSRARGRAGGRVFTGQLGKQDARIEMQSYTRETKQPRRMRHLERQKRRCKREASATTEAYFWPNSPSSLERQKAIDSDCYHFAFMSRAYRRASPQLLKLLKHMDVKISPLEFPLGWPLALTPRWHFAMEKETQREEVEEGRNLGFENKEV